MLWQTTLQEGTLRWLLEEDNPTVRYLTLKEILEKPETAPEVTRAKSRINSEGWVSQILEKQREGRYWESGESCYVPKWTSSAWQIIALANLEASGEDPRIRNACKHLLELHNMDEGGLSLTPKNYQEARPHICNTGNFVRALLKLGYGADSTIRKAVDWLLTQQLPDGGWNCFTRFGGKNSSFTSTIQPLWALSELRKVGKSSSEIENAISRAAEFFLARRLFKSADGEEPVMMDWATLHYPLHYKYDFLHGLRVLISAGVGNDERMGDALQLLVQKRNTDGSWNLEGVYRGWRLDRPMHKPSMVYRPEEDEVIRSGWGNARTFQLEEAGRPSKWLTLTALRVLKKVGMIELEARN